MCFGRTLYIDRDDFQEVPEPGFKRLSPGKDVRLMQAYVIACDEVIKNAEGEVVELRCTYDPVTLGGKKPADGHKVKGIIQWLSAQDAVDAEVRLYDRLFKVPHPANEDDLMPVLNPDALRVLPHAKVEACLAKAAPETAVQFNRVGYFVADRLDHSEAAPVFNRVVALRDVWSQVEAGS